MRFNHPDAIFFLLVLLVAIFIVASRYQSIRQRLQKLGSSQVRAAILPNYQPRLVVWVGILLLSTMLFLVLSLMEPQWGSKEEMVKRRGIDMMVLVDVSNSMLAQDLSPNRLEHERRKLSDLLNMLAGDRVGLVLFAGRSILASPLTNDYGSLQLFVDELSPDQVTSQGTDFLGALTLAYRVLSEANQNNKAILLMTDGEDHSEGMTAILSKLKAAEIRLYVLGIGTGEGAPVPLASGGFKQDKQGQMVMSKLNEDLLKQLALETGGAYVRSIVSSGDLQELYQKGIRQRLTQSEFSATHKRLWITRFQYPLALALLLLLTERILTYLPRFWIKPQNLLLFLLCFGMSNNALAYPFALMHDLAGQTAYNEKRFHQAAKDFSQAANKSKSFDDYYNLGVSQYRLGEFDQAQKNFAIVTNSKNPTLKNQAFYNLGNTYYRQDKLTEALEAYTNALAVDPKDTQSQLNYEFVKRKLEEQQQKEKEQEQQQQDQQKQNESQPQSGGQESGEQKDKENKPQDEPSKEAGKEQESSQGDPKQNNQSDQTDQSGEKSKPEAKDTGKDMMDQAPTKPEDLAGEVENTQKNDQQANEQQKNPGQPELSDATHQDAAHQDAQRLLNMVEDHAGKIFMQKISPQSVKTMERDW